MTDSRLDAATLSALLTGTPSRNIDAATLSALVVPATSARNIDAVTLSALIANTPAAGDAAPTTGALKASAPYSWYAANSISAFGGDAISTLADWGSGANNATQTTDGAKPIYLTNVINAKPVLRFDGSNDYMQSAASASAPSQTIMFVGKMTATGALGTIRGSVGGTNGNGGFNLGTSGNGNLRSLAQNIAVLGTSDSTPWSSHEYHVVFVTNVSGGSWSFRIDGAVAGSGTSLTGISGGLTTAIGLNLPTSYGAFDMCELASWNRILTPTEQEAIWVEMKAKWSTARKPLTGLAFTALTSFSADWVPTNLGDGRVGNATPPTYSYSPTGAGQTGWVKAQLPWAKTVTRYMIAARTDAGVYCPTGWTLEGSNDNSTWTPLDTRSVSAFANAEFRSYDFVNTTAYLYYRLSITTTGNGLQPTFSELTFYEADTPVASGTGFWGIAQVLDTSSGGGSGGAGPSYANAVLGLNPIAYYRFEQTNGDTTILDVSGYGRHLPMTAGTSSFGTNTPGAVGTGKAWVSTGGQTAGIGTPPWWSGLTAFSASVWFKVSASGNQALIGSDQVIQAPGNAGRKMALYLGNGPLVFMRFTSAGGFPFAQTPLSYNDGNWHHCVITSAAVPGTNAQKIYIDGALVAQQSSTGTWSGTSGDFTLAYLEVTYQLTGSMDEAVIFDRELTLAEVTTLYTGTP